MINHENQAAGLQPNSYSERSEHDTLVRYSVKRTNGKIEDGWFGVGSGVRNGVEFTRVEGLVDDPNNLGSKVRATKDIPTAELLQLNNELAQRRSASALGASAAELVDLSTNEKLSADPAVEERRRRARTEADMKYNQVVQFGGTNEQAQAAADRIWKSCGFK